MFAQHLHQVPQHQNQQQLLQYVPHAQLQLLHQHKHQLQLLLQHQLLAQFVNTVEVKV
jgi:hypothetical protein